jgi:phosphoglycolate phosphatase
VPFELVFFDLDGTLADTCIDIANGVNFALKGLGFKPLELERIRRHIGGGAKLLIQRCLPGIEEPLLEKAYQIFLRYYAEHLVDNTTLYPHVSDVLKQLKGLRKAVVTNKPEAMSKEILKHFGILGLFYRVAGGDTFIRKKPDPEPVLTLIQECNVKGEGCLMVGDTHADIQMARAARIKVCAVTYGYHGGMDLTGADFLADSFPQVGKIIMEGR